MNSIQATSSQRYVIPQRRDASGERAQRCHVEGAYRFHIPDEFRRTQPLWFPVVQELIDKVRSLRPDMEGAVERLFYASSRGKEKAEEFAALLYLMTQGEVETEGVTSYREHLIALLTQEADAVRFCHKKRGSKQWAVGHEILLLHHFSKIIFPLDQWYNRAGVHLVKSLIRQSSLARCFKCYHLEQMETVLGQMLREPKLTQLFHQEVTLSPMGKALLRSAQLKPYPQPITGVDLNREMVRFLLSVEFQQDASNCYAVAVVRFMKRAHIYPLLTIVQNAYCSGNVEIQGESVAICSLLREAVRGSDAVIRKSQGELWNSPFTTWVIQQIGSEQQFAGRAVEVWRAQFFNEMYRVVLLSSQLHGINVMEYLRSIKCKMVKTLFDRVYNESQPGGREALGQFYHGMVRTFWFQDLPPSSVHWARKGRGKDQLRRSLHVLQGNRLSRVTHYGELAKTILSLLSPKFKQARAFFQGRESVQLLKDFVSEVAKQKGHKATPRGLVFPQSGGYARRTVEALNVHVHEQTFHATTIPRLLKALSTCHYHSSSDEVLVGMNDHLMTASASPGWFSTLESQSQSIRDQAADYLAEYPTETEIRNLLSTCLGADVCEGHFSRLMLRPTYKDVRRYCVRHARSREWAENQFHAALDRDVLSSDKQRTLIKQLYPHFSAPSIQKIALGILDGTPLQMALQLRKKLLEYEVLPYDVQRLERAIAQFCNRSHKVTFADTNWSDDRDAVWLRLGYHFGRDRLAFFLENKQGCVLADDQEQFKVEILYT